MNARRVGVVALTVLLLAAPVLAHVPSFPSDNTSPERAVVVPDAVKSWSFYDRLGEGEVKYYRFSLAAGDRLLVGAFTPVAGEFTPSLVVMSESLPEGDEVPPGVVVPDGMGAIVVEGSRPDGAGYEPFAPSANYRTAGLSRPVDADTTYLVAVYDPQNRSGPAGFTVGYAEDFSAVEYATVPFDLVRTHLWAGQHPLVAVGPVFLTVFVGLGALWRRQPDAVVSSPARLLLVVAGLLILGSGVNTLVQMGVALSATGLTPAALVTAAFVVIPVAIGGWVVRRALRDENLLTVWTRAGLVVAGGLALATWAGFIVAPVVVLGAAVAPTRLLSV